MASTNPVSNNDQWNYVANTSGTAKTTGNSTLGKDQFLKILITQLQNQDPMQPMEDKEFIAQMAQFSSVEQLMNISTQLTAMNQSLGSVSGLIGKDITWNDASTELPKSGNVESIVVSSGIHYAVVGSERIALTDIIQIQNAAPKADLVNSTESSGSSEESGASI
ncbi:MULTISPECIES: flagellar hook assembly protein FlgD [unclassified Paenibacillus]|uniref:flagellar hook assembly protein FlgD n=1 Tax=unclassified Paenibacillus TaxID=185978 RepID=UPI0024067D84|nr:MULTISPECIES: flagellar hook assembly protein FlgD [unclassified Paenibacillus]MDF9841380.1 flagellar basal-body rod modification protein FlgD [Paenibacillus sp. PastF-2]MDF9847971.1 flagellar basal-body rod modification protein FlgD [Paenibacillus sp. PastM-2]MDF9854539.1 flagellar basal-body rod modification protein FlgD [Paenibacillus sp. PastF-1]MDH6479852.1 flagellar basal-body rod modification protein FlgD [Paenibacillus sp. PastH-2]MDH6507246.1 flagellar basal-body rod modification p